MAILSRVFYAADQAGPESCDGPGYRLVSYTARAPGLDKSNEDCAGWVSLGSGRAVFLVADGLGGLPAGREVSAMAVRIIVESPNGIDD